MKLTRTFAFDAAHVLSDYDGPCGNLHGHRWRVKYTISGEKDEETGMIIDFVKLKKVEKRITGVLDHSFVNDTIKIPTCENIAEWIFTVFHLDLDGRVDLEQVEVWETENSSAIYTRQDFMETVDIMTYLASRNIPFIKEAVATNKATATEVELRK